MIQKVKIELCINTIDDIINSSKLALDSLELNCATEVEGLTPSLSLFLEAKRLSNARLNVMIRPRAGGFCYSMSSYELMKRDAQLFLENGADGLVFGFLKPDKTIDQVRTKEFIDLIHSYGAIATFHKAFDLVPDKQEAVAILTRLGVDRILTSVNNYKEDSDIEFVAGGGINAQNVASLIAKGIKSIHFSAKEVIAEEFGNYNRLSVLELEKIIEQINKG